MNKVNICRSESACSKRSDDYQVRQMHLHLAFWKNAVTERNKKNTQKSVLFLVHHRGLEPILRRYNHNKYWTQCNTGVSGGNIVRYLMSESEYWSSRKEQKNTQRSVLFLVLPRGLEPRTHWLRVSCSTNWAKEAY